MTDLRIPTSPAHGIGSTFGDATHGPFVQLLNPGGSGVNLFVYELRLAADFGAGTSRIRVRRTSSPLTLGGTITTAPTERMDQRNFASIAAQFKGCTAVSGTLFDETVSFWFDRILGSGIASNIAFPGRVLIPQCFPIIVVPGSAIEVANPDASATNALRVYAVWDEL